MTHGSRALILISVNGNSNALSIIVFHVKREAKQPPSQALAYEGVVYGKIFLYIQHIKKSLYNEMMQLFIFRCGIGQLRDRTAGDSPQI